MRQTPALRVSTVGVIRRASLIALLLTPLPVIRASAQSSEAKADNTNKQAEQDGHSDIIIEADLPAGFPQPGPAGEPLIKQYPPYRAAQAEGFDAFWKLFRHIQRNNLPMTAPVEMLPPPPPEAPPEGKTPPRDDTGVMRTMMFLYPDAEQHQLGPDPQDPDVTVKDHPAQRVVTYGFFGNPSPTRIAQANQAIDALLAQDDTLTPQGPRRLLGYNSPMIPEPNRYFEWQQPLAD